jgi:hypothetical protein
MPAILKELEARGFRPRVRLSDLQPSLAPMPTDRVTWIDEPVDATHVPAGLAGVRTIFSAFHHFRPETARSILRDACEQGRAICVFEAGSATALSVLSMILVPLYVLALMPLVRPARWEYLLFTYVIPVLPLVILWDGMVSMLRVYSAEQLRELTRELQRPSYGWEIGELEARGIPGKIPYLIGRPIG